MLQVRLTNGARQVGGSDGAASLLAARAARLTPAGPRKRPPGPLAVRRRYGLVQWASVAVGGLAAAVVVAAALADFTTRRLVPDQVFYAFALLVLAVGLGAAVARGQSPVAVEAAAARLGSRTPRS